jgi:hypothetical protein
MDVGFSSLALVKFKFQSNQTAAAYAKTLTKTGAKCSEVHAEHSTNQLLDLDFVLSVHKSS